MTYSRVIDILVSQSNLELYFSYLSFLKIYVIWLVSTL